MYMIGFAIETWNFPAVPFLLLFVGGYWWAGFARCIRNIRAGCSGSANARWRSEPSRSLNFQIEI